jgi:hypothetical protein
MNSFHVVELAASGGIYRDEQFTYGTLTELQQSLDFLFWVELRAGCGVVLVLDDIPLRTYLRGRLSRQIDLRPFIHVRGPNGVAFNLPQTGTWYTLDEQNGRRLIRGTDVPADEAFLVSALVSIDWGAVPVLALEEPVLGPGEEAEYEYEYRNEVYRESFKYGYFNAESSEDVGDEFQASLDEALMIDPGWLVFNDGAVRGLAGSMHRTGDYSAMPILADALQEAGCENELMLLHCRSPAGTHARGSWLVERLRRS